MSSGSGICGLIETFNTAIINPALLLIFAAGTLGFVYGVVEFIWGVEQGNDLKEDGKRHMLWGLIGMFIMVSAWAIIKLIAGAVGGNLSCNI